MKSVAPPVAPRWKVALWEKNSVEPAMLRVPVVIIVFIILWGICLYALERCRVDYGFVLSTRTGPFSFIFSSALVLTILYALCMTIFSNSLGFSIESGITIFYMLTIMVLWIPRLPFSESLSHLGRLLRQCLLPGPTVSFPEVLVADALTSLSKVFKDLGVTAVAVYCAVYGMSPIELHNQSMILIAVLASLPYWIRIVQCRVQLSSCPDFIARVPVFLNIIKYFSAFPPIWLTAYASLGYTLPNMQSIVTGFAAVNSIYSFLWDVIMDWGLLTFTRDGRVHTRSRLLLPALTYLLVTLVNLALRFSWAINRVPGMDQLHSSVIVLVVEVGEVLRRAMWAAYRIEWEVIVQQDRAIEKDPVLAEKLRVKYPGKLLPSSGKESSSPLLMLNGGGSAD